MGEKNFQCQICLDRWNESRMREQDGLKVCPDCWEPHGGTQDRDRDRAAASVLAASLAAKEQVPPKFPGWGDSSNIVAVNAYSVRPLVLSRGGAAGALRITGVGMSSADVILYGAAGLTDAVPPIYSSLSSTPAPPYDTPPVVIETYVDLSVQASGGMQPGPYSLTYNGSLFRAVFSVH